MRRVCGISSNIPVSKLRISLRSLRPLRFNLAVEPRRIWGVGSLAAACLLLAGCGDSRAPVPPLNPGRAADLAMQELDKDRDGTLTKEEIAGSPGMLATTPTATAS
jgi:hypothetical protein